jgi:hypothetical protein
MPPRIEDHQAPPGAAKAMMDLQHYVDTCGLEPALLELVKLRASQINGWNRLAISCRWLVGGYRPKRSSLT